MSTLKATEEESKTFTSLSDLWPQAIAIKDRVDGKGMIQEKEKEILKETLEGFSQINKSVHFYKSFIQGYSQDDFNLVIETMKDLTKE